MGPQSYALYFSTSVSQVGTHNTWHLHCGQHRLPNTGRIPPLLSTTLPSQATAWKGDRPTNRSSSECTCVGSISHRIDQGREDLFQLSGKWLQSVHMAGKAAARDWVVGTVQEAGKGNAVSAGSSLLRFPCSLLCQAPNPSVQGRPPLLSSTLLEHPERPRVGPH